MGLHSTKRSALSTKGHAQDCAQQPISSVMKEDKPDARQDQKGQARDSRTMDTARRGGNDGLLRQQQEGAETQLLSPRALPSTEPATRKPETGHTRPVRATRGTRAHSAKTRNGTHETSEDKEGNAGTLRENQKRGHARPVRATRGTRAHSRAPGHFSPYCLCRNAGPMGEHTQKEHCTQNTPCGFTRCKSSLNHTRF